MRNPEVPEPFRHLINVSENSGNGGDVHDCGGKTHVIRVFSTGSKINVVTGNYGDGTFIDNAAGPVNINTLTTDQARALMWLLANAIQRAENL